MIREFWVENYYSIKDRQTLNFESKGNYDAFTSVMVDEKTRLNKIAILYGANASGKTNFLVALQAIFSLLVNPKRDRSHKIGVYQPFALLKGEPTNMYVSFYHESIRYDYEISFNESYILKEELNYYPNGSKALFYKREFISDSAAAKISFGTSVGIKKKTEDTFISRTLNNHTVLSTYTNTSFEEEIPKVSNLYNWIRNYVHNIDGDYSNTESIAEMLKKVENDEKMKRFYLQMIAKADFNIIDFHYEETPKVYSEKERKLILENTSIPEQIKENILNGKNQDIIFTSKAGANSFDLKINDQSSGTLMFLRRLRLLYDMVTENHVYFLDEPESDLHYDLFLFYLNTFIYNSEKTQLIMSSHLTSLLAEDLINDQRDLIYFVEKDSDTASSSCKRADKFGLHKNQSLYNAYKTGKFGAKPALGSPFILND